MTRHFLLVSALSLGFVGSLPPAVVHADDASQNLDGKHQLVGEINASDVFVRSGPSEEAYPTRKLEKGDKVTVVGIKANTWLKILPPKDSFAYVPKVYIERHGSGNVGRASREIIAKVGSDLNPMKIAPMATVEVGEDVTILGDQDEYYKIAPPTGSVVYVHKQFVDFVKALPAPGDAAENVARSDVPPSAGNNDHEPMAGTTTRPADLHPRGGNAVAETNTTQPAPTALNAQFDKLETEFAAANDKALTEQPLPELLTGYQSLEMQDGIPNSMKRVAEVRIATLKLRDEARTDFQSFKQAQAKLAGRTKALVAERQEIEDRIKQNDVAYFTVVGTLRTSSLQRGQFTMYRVTDPESGRTVAYLRSNDTKYAQLLGQFVGIKGTLNTDSALNMKVIDQPTAVQVVDPAKVNTSVAAQLIPPSLMPKVTQQASTDNQ